MSSRRRLDQSENAHSQINREHKIALAGLKAAESKLAEAGTERTQLSVIDCDLSVLKHSKTELLFQLEKQKVKPITERGWFDKLFSVFNKNSRLVFIFKSSYKI